jgi:hypothetical protein
MVSGRVGQRQERWLLAHALAGKVRVRVSERTVAVANSRKACVGHVPCNLKRVGHDSPATVSLVADLGRPRLDARVLASSTSVATNSGEARSRKKTDTGAARTRHKWCSTSTKVVGMVAAWPSSGCALAATNDPRWSSASWGKCLWSQPLSPHQIVASSQRC